MECYSYTNGILLPKYKITLDSSAYKWDTIEFESHSRILNADLIIIKVM